MGCRTHGLQIAVDDGRCLIMEIQNTFHYPFPLEVWMSRYSSERTEKMQHTKSARSATTTRSPFSFRNRLASPFALHFIFKPTLEEPLRRIRETHWRDKRAKRAKRWIVSISIEGVYIRVIRRSPHHPFTENLLLSPSMSILS
jgi:hypothetical protein